MQGSGNATVLRKWLGSNDTWRGWRAWQNGRCKRAQRECRCLIRQRAHGGPRQGGSDAAELAMTCSRPRVDVGHTPRLNSAASGAIKGAGADSTHESGERPCAKPGSAAAASLLQRQRLSREHQGNRHHKGQCALPLAAITSGQPVGGAASCLHGLLLTVVRSSTRVTICRPRLVADAAAPCCVEAGQDTGAEVRQPCRSSGLAPLLHKQGVGAPARHIAHCKE
jgi:hypothetical protein